MNTKHWLLLGVGSFLALSTASAQADWQGDVHMKMTMGGDNRDVYGQIHGHPGAFRMDLTAPKDGKMAMMGDMSMIVDWKSRKVVNAMHGRKMYMEMDMDRSGVGFPKCDGTDIDACLTKGGYKKTGSENANGHPCTVYEHDQETNGKQIHTKLWRPNDLKEVPFVRNSTSEGRRLLTYMDVTNAKIAPQAAALFAPPAGYGKMEMPAFVTGGGAQRGQNAQGAPGAMPPGLHPGMTPEEIAKFREQMMKQYGAGKQ